MNKTVSCNISGLIFNLEELAYDRLDSYLKKLKNYLSGTEGKDEIYADIELRIAELFSSKLGDYNQVIVLKDVEEVIATLGDPKDYVDIEADENQEGIKEEEPVSGQRKVFMRDTDNGVIAGVCSGLSAYFGIDLTLVRVLFIIFLIFPGFGGLAYIILWIAAPSAKTAADKLRLRGEPVNIDSLKKEVQEAAQRVEEYSKRKFSKDKVDHYKRKTSKFGRTIRAIIGFFILLGAMFSILFFLVFSLSRVGIFTSDHGEQLVSMYEFSAVIFSSTWQSFLGWAGILGSVLIPLIIIAILGAKLLFNLKGGWVKYPSTLLIIFWFLSIGMLTIAGLQIGREFTHIGETHENIGNIQTDKLIINVPEMYLEEVATNKEGHSTTFLYKPILELEDEEIKSGMVTLRMSTSKDSLFHVYRERSSYGITQNKALRLAANIMHDLKIEGNELLISPFYLYPTEDKLRAQKVTIYVEVPEGAAIEWKGNKKQLNIRKRLN